MDEASDRLRDAELRHSEERRAVEEAGGGESEGFELAEQELIEHASHGDDHTPTRIMLDAAGQQEGASAEEAAPDAAVYGDADEESKPD